MTEINPTMMNSMENDVKQLNEFCRNTLVEHLGMSLPLSGKGGWR